MRRIVAFFALTISIVLGIAINFTAVVNKTKANIEYSTGREMTFRISDKEDETALVDEDAIDYIALQMESRLETAGVSKYQISKEGNDIVRVTFSEKTDLKYERIRRYLAFDSEFTIRIADEDNTTAIAVGDDMFDNSVARVEYRNAFPVIVIPLSDPTWFTNNIVSAAEEIQGAQQTQDPTQAGQQAELVQDATIVLWTGFDPDEDSFTLAQTDQDVANKILITFDYRNIWWDASETENTEIATAVSVGEADDNGQYDVSQIALANDTANYMVNLFNAGSLDYKVDFLFETTVEPTIENILNYNQIVSIALSRTLISMIVSFVLVGAVMFAFYKVNAIAAITTSTLNVFLSLVFYNAVGMEFSSGGLVGLIVVFILGIYSAIVYFTKVKDELYRGRTMKKANAEASKKSNALIIDASLVIFAVGMIAYVLGGPSLQGYATFTIFGSVLNLILVLLGNKVLIWLLTNNTNTQKNFALIGVDATKVPNILKEEKQTYFGRFADQDLTKNKKSTGIVMGAIASLTSVALIVFGVLSMNVLSLAKTQDDFSRIYFTVTDNSPIDTLSSTNSPEKILERITYDGKAIAFTSYDVQEKTVREGSAAEGKIEVNYVYYIYNLEFAFTGDEIVSYTDWDDNADNATLFDAISVLVESIDDEATVSVNFVDTVAPAPSFWRVGLTTIVALAAVSLYLIIRNGLSRGLSAFVVAVMTSLVTLAFFMATRIAVTPITAIAILFAGLASFLLSILAFNREKELKAESKEKEVVASPERTVKAIALMAAPGAAIGLITMIIVVNYFGLGPVAVAWLFAGLLLGELIALLLNVKLLAPITHFFEKLFGRYHVNIRLPRKQKARKVEPIRHRSAEPQEATFIGIND